MLNDAEMLPEQIMYKPLFDLVADKKNWKLPINTTVRAPHFPADRELFRKLIIRAIEFYAGGDASSFEYETNDVPYITFVAPGYYNLIGS